MRSITIGTALLLLLGLVIAQLHGPTLIPGIPKYQQSNSMYKYQVFVNFAQPSYEKRLYIVKCDVNKPCFMKNISKHTLYVKNGEIVYQTWVAHGSGSGMGKYAKKFSNEKSSHASSLGVYITGDLYKGKHGLSRRLYGQSKTNSNAYSREIVIHSASYIGQRYGHIRTGHSWGCFAVPEDAIKTILIYTPPGTILVAFH